MTHPNIPILKLRILIELEIEGPLTEAGEIWQSLATRLGFTRPDYVRFCEVAVDELIPQDGVIEKP